MTGTQRHLRREAPGEQGGMSKQMDPYPAPRRAVRLLALATLVVALGACARERTPASYPQQQQYPQGQGQYGPYTYNPNGYGPQQPGTYGGGTVPTATPPPPAPNLGTALEALGVLVRTIPGVLVVPPAGAPPATTAPPPAGVPPVATASPPAGTVPPPAAPPVASPPPVANDQATAFENEVFRLTNEQRARGGVCGGQTMPPVPPVAYHASLQVAARRHSQDMATRGYFEHDTPEGKRPHQRAMEAGFPSSYVGENIGSGYTDAAKAMAGWMASTGHCRNIMKADYRFLGVGYGYTTSGDYHHYWTQNFGGG